MLAHTKREFALILLRVHFVRVVKMLRYIPIIRYIDNNDDVEEDDDDNNKKNDNGHDNNNNDN